MNPSSDHRLVTTCTVMAPRLYNTSSINLVLDPNCEPPTESESSELWYSKSSTKPLMPMTGAPYEMIAQQAQTHN